METSGFTYILIKKGGGGGREVKETDKGILCLHVDANANTIMCACVYFKKRRDERK